jgi:hypothetical protein
MVSDSNADAHDRRRKRFCGACVRRNATIREDQRPLDADAAVFETVFPAGGHIIGTTRGVAMSQWDATRTALGSMGRGMQPHDIAAVLTRDRVAFTSDSDREPLAKLHALGATDVLDLPVTCVEAAARRPGPDLWILSHHAAIEIAWRSRGWAGLIAIVRPGQIMASTRLVGHTHGRFAMGPHAR